jgi:hypothetical protein
MKALNTLLIVGAMIVTTKVGAVTYDAAADFSLTTNPNGVWSYGWSNTRDTEKHLYTHLGSQFDGAFQLWNDPTANPDSTGDPTVIKNVSDYVPPTTAEWLPGTMGFVPFKLGDRAVGFYSWVIFTAPTKGLYKVDAIFKGVDASCGHGTETDVNIFRDNEQLFLGNIEGYGDTEAYSYEINLSLGDTISFGVGWGSNGNSDCDNTGFDGKITFVSESFAAFNPGAQLKVGPKTNDDSFELTGYLRLAETSNGIDPPKETVTVKFGSFSHTIPAGSFQQGRDGSFHFKGTIDKAKLDVTLWPLTNKSAKAETIQPNWSQTGTSYWLRALVSCSDLAATTMQPQARLTIGNDQGQATLDVGYAKFGKGKDGQKWVFPEGETAK